jgi:hypothetical protein
VATPRSSFVAERASDAAAAPVAGLLAEHAGLGGYAAAFEGAEIDAALAADLSGPHWSN